LEFLIKAGGVRVGDSYLRDQIMLFIKSVIAAADNTPRTALVFSLQSSKRESLEDVNLLQTVDHLAARKDQRREPVHGNQILSVIQRRLVDKLPADAAGGPAANGLQ